MRFLVILTFIIVIISGCRKEDSSCVDYSVIVVNSNLNMHKITFINDSTGFVCGGKMNQYGMIYKTTDGGSSWNEVYFDDEKCIYSISFLNDTTGYAGGDYLFLLKTVDAGKSWAFQDFGSNVPFNEFDRPAFRDFFFVDTSLFFAIGGEKYSKGIIYKITNNSTTWKYTFFEHEIRGIYFTDKLNGFISGYGVIYKTADEGDTYESCDITGDFYTSLFFFDKNTGFATGYNGGIYKTDDAGSNWESIVNSNNTFKERLHINDMKFTGETGYAVGNNGLIMVTHDSGNSWEIVKNFSGDNFYSLYIKSADEIMIAAENGKVYFVNF